VKPDFKKLKDKLREGCAAQKEFAAYLKEETAAFQETVIDQLELIKAAKEARIAAIKQTPLYKKYNNTKLSFSFMLAKFQKKYPTITTYDMRRKLGRTNWYRMRYAGPAYEIKRVFKLKKWY
jgi:predicted Zn-dependent protease